MSIVGTQSVSMSDLMKLGPQALGAMAQGQMQSIAPSYMVIAALKALTDQQKGAGAQSPQGTVKDQIVAQATQPQPMQAGIGAMQPPMQPPMKKFADGGGVGTAGINARIAEYFRQMLGPGWDRVKEETRRGLAGHRRTVDEVNYSNEGRGNALPEGVQATAPTTPDMATDPAIRVGMEKGRATNTNPIVPGSASASVSASNSTGSRITAPAADRGIAATGTNPLGKYATLGPTATADQYKLDIPKNEQLQAAAAKFAAPDAARMAELKNAEESAGLAAFGRGMLNTKNGTGFGAVFGSASADYVDAKEAKAVARREYEDRREALATQLGIQVGAEAKEDYLKNSEWGAKRADEANKLAVDQLRAKNEGTRFENADTLDREKMAQTERLENKRLDIMREANSIAASVRKDGLDTKKFDKLIMVQQTAAKNARDFAEATVGKADDPVNFNNPDFQRKFNFVMKREYERTFPPDMEALMRGHLGLSATPAAPTNAPVNRGKL